ncbi:hypothetical protein BDV23DRAFT_159123 [Aspergillus alliaceus]|uniref:Uncharacterized protein n=1 Tax=Petromyces alliaceus TaxID=209559 RepID=A0A5N7C438_PETAA|nr:hypothetical protein BDV23DRAFT_159123 [Aspergillus alliaceus]
MNDQPPAYHEAARSSATPAAVDKKAQLNQNGILPRYALLSISWTDRIRLMRFPEPLVARVTEILEKLWTKGIQNVKSQSEGVEFKLRGTPFSHSGDEEKIAVRKLMLGILDGLAREGWGVHPGAGGLGKIGNYSSLGEKGSVIFQPQQPQQLSWLCISFDSQDLIHLMNAPIELAMSLIGVLEERIQTCNQDLVSGTFELKFKKNLWKKSSSEGAVQSRLVALDVLQCLESQGYSLCASVDLDHGDGGDLYQSSADIWFCCR